jgi:hypothetical protein
MFTVSNNSVIVQNTSSLVATPLPNAQTLRVPYDNVTPTVSNPKLENNASGNRTQPSKSEAPPPAPVVAAQPAEGDVAVARNTNPPYLQTPTGFLVQLASSDASPEAQGLLGQYEKLVNLGNVKYKPSGAGKPSAPTGLFNLFLRNGSEESLPAVSALELTQPATPAEPLQSVVATESAPLAAVSETTSAELEAVATNENAPETAPTASNEGFAALRQSAAYTATTARNNELLSQNTTRREA